MRVDQQTAKAEGLEPGDRLHSGEWPESPVRIVEHGIEYFVDLRHGQKTGLYLDQRDNRLAAARYVKDRRVLDVCTYLGGFAMVAAKIGGATEVIGVDTSAAAVASATEHASRNQIPQARFEQADCFDMLAGRRANGEKFDAVILDPPRFAGSRQNVDNALRAYGRLNRDAIGLLSPGGILVTCSCSGRVTREDFLKMLMDSGRQTGRDLVVLESRTAAPDHLFRVSCPEATHDAANSVDAGHSTDRCSRRRPHAGPHALDHPRSTGDDAAAITGPQARRLQPCPPDVDPGQDQADFERERAGLGWELSRLSSPLKKWHGLPAHVSTHRESRAGSPCHMHFQRVVR